MKNIKFIPIYVFSFVLCLASIDIVFSKTMHGVMLFGGASVGLLISSLMGCGK